MTTMFMFFIICLFVFVLSLYYFEKYRKQLLLLFIIGFVAGLLMEIWGVQTGRWDYMDISTVWMIWSIPFEIMFAYGVGLMLGGGFIVKLFDKYDEGERVDAVIKALPIIGLITMVISAVKGYPMGISLTFFAVWGLSISERKSIPLIVGLTAFMFDILVEGVLTMTDDYHVWSYGVPLGFFLAGVTLGGWLTRKKCNPDKDLCFVEA